MPQVLFLGEPPGLQTLWSVYAQIATPAPKRWMDAYLAAFARGYDIPIITLDSDFLDFPELDVRMLAADNL
jgi:predicted nucleic acid-binding protein